MVKAGGEEAKKRIKDAIPAYDYFIITMLKKYDKNTALGKKSIMDELVPLFSRITNQVLFDHYSKKIASELDLSEEAVLSVMKKGNSSEQDNEVLYPEAKVGAYKQNPEGYFIALVLKAPIEVSQEFLSKVKPQDFQNENLKMVLESLIAFVEGKKRAISISSLLKKYDEGLQKVVSELYLWDLEGMIDFENEEKSAKELDFAVKRIKLESTKQLLKDLSDEIKIAEVEKDSEKLTKLTKRFERLSKGLL
jgi:DNA primase